jgi:uncharacterized protein (DUF58 family)
MGGIAERISTRKLKGPEVEPVHLAGRRIYILPTRHGLMFALVLLVMLLGSINYNNSLGYALTFLLGGLALVSMLHTQRNLVGLVVESGRAEPVFAGQTASFPVLVHARNGVSRFALAAQAPGFSAEYGDVQGTRTRRFHVPARATHRGRLRLARFKVFTEFPLGLFHAWTWVELDTWCLVYPQPAEEPLPFSRDARETGPDATAQGPGQDDFSDLRLYRPGDSPRHVAWRRTAQTDELLTKRFIGGAARTLWLDWDQLDGLMAEQRLSRLCRWVLDCHAAGYRYGVRLPGTVIEPGSGEAHRQQCLETLALFRTVDRPHGAPGATPGRKWR